MDVLSPNQPFNQKKRLLVVQIGAGLAAAVMLFAQPHVTGEMHEMMEFTGLVLVGLCIVGRLWSILYVGGRKNAELVTDGPYSVTRNPLYVFSTIGAAGIGLMFGSIIIAAVLATFTFGILLITAEKEAAFLSVTFGSAYDAYARRTPMFWPNPFLYKDASAVTFSPNALKRAFADCLYFVAVFPAIELVEHLHAIGIIPVFFKLY